MHKSTMIRVGYDVKERLDSMKYYQRESYGDVISRMLDACGEEGLTDEDIMDIEKSLDDLKHGRYRTIEEVMKEEGMSVD